MTQKIPGIFCPLKHQEWVRACKELTPAERDVFYYIPTRDPYNSGIEISAAAIARDLSIPERTVHRQTISRALKVLAYIGLIDKKYGRVRCSFSTERQIRARLNKKLGGLIEVPTTVNRIDLLLRALKETPPERAERAFAAFLNWAACATNVRDIYKALEVAILRGWEK